MDELVCGNSCKRQAGFYCLNVANKSFFQVQAPHLRVFSWAFLAAQVPETLP